MRTPESASTHTHARVCQHTHTHTHTCEDPAQHSSVANEGRGHYARRGLYPRFDRWHLPAHRCLPCRRKGKAQAAPSSWSCQDLGSFSSPAYLSFLSLRGARNLARWLARRLTVSSSRKHHTRTKRPCRHLADHSKEKTAPLGCGLSRGVGWFAASALNGKIPGATVCP